MTKIIVEADLANSDRKEFIKDFNKAFATGDADFIISHVSEDISWSILGDKQIEGKEAFVVEINIMKDYTADELVIHSIITHGMEASVNGEMKMGGSIYAFCDVYLFTSTTSNILRKMTSYVIKTR